MKDFKENVKRENQIFFSSFFHHLEKPSHPSHPKQNYE
jgi:hypothetical protein